MTEDITVVDGEKLRIEQRNTRLKNWALLLGGIAAVATAATSMLSSLGVDDLIARRHSEQNAQAKEAYDTLVESNKKLRKALHVAFRRIKDLENDVAELKQDYKLSWMVRMTTVAGTPAPAKPPAAPVISSDVNALLAAPPPDPVPKSGSLFGIFDTTESPDEGVEILEEAAPPKWEQVQKRAQEAP